VKKTAARVMCLDGLRALSIILVVVGHLGGTRGSPLGKTHVVLPFLASMGVGVFFVISGYLITRLLLAEQESRGSIQLSGFYFRRIFRILVPYYTFLAAIALASRLGWVQLAPGDLGYALTYTSNYHLHPAWPLAHTWSLAVEEQFYLLWPALLVTLGVRRAMWLAAAFLVSAPFGRLFVWYAQPEMHDLIGHTFGTVADTIAAGCLLAVISDRLWKKGWYRALLESKWFALVPIAVLAMVVVDDRPRLAYTVALPVNLCLALIVDRCMRLPSSWATRLLSLAPIAAIGRVSYSIYLWQQVFLDRTSTTALTAFPVNLVAVALVATAAYFVIEKPSMAARSSLEAWFQQVLTAPGRRPASVGKEARIA
jgi:peptidoglycan/LPS O-acetylase OafA/YrhL